MSVVAVIGIGSDIGRELARRFIEEGATVWGTVRSAAQIEALPAGVRSSLCDLASRQSMDACVDEFAGTGLRWDVLIVAAGTEEPIGDFWDCDPNEWERGVQINALAPLRLVRQFYRLRNRELEPAVAFFSGSGTNNAAPAYSAYSASKILLMKMCELLDAESSDTSFFIVGPGIVRTKIHEQTVRARERGGSNYRKVIDFLDSPDPGTSHDDIHACIQWCIKAGKSVVGGRNLALVHDAWRGGGAELARALAKDPNLYKLRRYGNDLRLPMDDA